MKNLPDFSSITNVELDNIKSQLKDVLTKIPEDKGRLMLELDDLWV
jgi:hypothetical protein